MESLPDLMIETSRKFKESKDFSKVKFKRGSKEFKSSKRGSNIYSLIMKRLSSTRIFEQTLCCGHTY